MLNKELNLNQDIFNEDVKVEPTRNGFGRGLKNAGEENKDIVALCCDLTESTRMHYFRDAFPDRFIQIGVAEQNLASVASGMAAMGKIPFISSYAMFSPGRNWEQIRTTICYNNVNVKIIGSHAGVSVGPDGGTHQAIEDIAITRVIPRMNVIYPCDSIQAQKATEQIAKNSHPTYLRLARENTSIISSENTPFQIGKSQLLWNSEGKKISLAIVSAGPILGSVLKVAKYFDQKGIGVKVLNMHTIKPLDKDALMDLAKCDKIMTVEEHQKIGGLGSTVSEFLSENKPTQMRILGIDDKFGESGTPEELLAKHGLDFEGIKKSVEDFLK